MEHPIFFLTKLLEVLGLGHFAHAYPHVTFTWLIMLLYDCFRLDRHQGHSISPLRRPESV